MWQTEWDLSAEGAGETINTAHQHQGGVSTALSHYAWRGRLLHCLAGEEPGELGHTLTLRPPDALGCCLFYDTWQDNESVAPVKISPLGVLACASFLYGGVLLYSFSRFTREHSHHMSIQRHLYFRCDDVQKPREAICGYSVPSNTGRRRKMSRKWYLQHAMTLGKKYLSANNVAPIISK